MSTDPLFMKQNGQYYWYHNDHLGTPQMMTTSSGAVAWSAKYTSFSKATVDPGSTVVNPLRMPGQYEDDETGLHYNSFRYYDPKIGRYLREDPIGFWGGINYFAFVANNPLNLLDPFGLLSQSFINASGGGWNASRNWYNSPHSTLRDWHYGRNQYNKNISFNEAKKSWKQMKPEKSIYHTMGPGNENNLKFVSPDGHSEAVFYPDGRHVTDPANMATYNFVDPNSNLIGHILWDVLPYYAYGNSPDDPTTPLERIKRLKVLFDGGDVCE